jgi:hypothetical protein
MQQVGSPANPASSPWCRLVGNDADISSGFGNLRTQCFSNQRLRCAVNGLVPAEELLAMNAKTRMRAERESAAIFGRYAAKLEAIAALDRAYYAKPSPGLAERAAYYQRQAVLERRRLRLYAELGRVREPAGYLPNNLPN